MEEDPIQIISKIDLEFISKWTSEPDIEKLRSHIINLWLLCKKTYHSYRCIERMMFLNPRLPKHFAYQTFIKILKESDKSKKKFLDLGCCFGQEVRQLILEGIPTNSITAADIHDGYWNVGREFFMDNLSHLSTRLDGVTTIFDDFAQKYPLPVDATNRIVDSLTNNFDAIICQMVFHVLTKEQTENLVRRMCSMIGKGGVLIGSCVGSKEEACSWGVTPKRDGVRYLQSMKSLFELLSENGFEGVEVKEIQINPEMAQRWKKEEIQTGEGQKEIKKCRYEFIAYKKS